MRIVHLADLHLGYRAYNRVTSQGINRREADVFNSFRSALDKIAELVPDLIIIAGDLFHTIRPSNLCIQQTFRAFLDLRMKRDVNAPIVIIGGNHDSPKSVDAGCILDLLTNIPNVYVAHNEYAGIRIPEIDTTVFCLCHRALPELSELRLEPDPASAHNVLAFHGGVEGAARGFTDAQAVKPSDILSDSWNYIAAGHYHMYTKLADNAYYSGATEFTSFNIWEEAGSPKGFIEYDTDTRQPTFHTLPTRPVVDMRLLDATDLDAKEVTELIQARVEGIDGGHTDKIIRLVVEGMHRRVQPDLDYALIRKLKSEALHFELQFRPVKRNVFTTYSDDRGQTRPLETEWSEYVEQNGPLPGGVDRDKLIDLGLDYLGRQEVSVE